MKKDQIRILKEDIQDLKYLIKVYIKQEDYEKASRCQSELRLIQSRLKEIKSSDN